MLAAAAQEVVVTGVGPGFAALAEVAVGGAALLLATQTATLLVLALKK